MDLSFLLPFITVACFHAVFAKHCGSSRGKCDITLDQGPGNTPSTPTQSIKVNTETSSPSEQALQAASTQVIFFLPKFATSLSLSENFYSALIYSQSTPPCCC